MSLPHWVVWRSRIPALFGGVAIGRPFAAVTLGFWTFAPGVHLSDQVRRHEYAHVKQFFLGWCVGAFLWLLFFIGESISPFWLLVTPFTFSGCYGLASLTAWITGGHPYRDNLFEREARIEAGEPL